MIQLNMNYYFSKTHFKQFQSIKIKCIIFHYTELKKIKDEMYHLYFAFYCILYLFKYIFKKQIITKILQVKYDLKKKIKDITVTLKQIFVSLNDILLNFLYRLLSLIHFQFFLLFHIYLYQNILSMQNILIMLFNSIKMCSHFKQYFLWTPLSIMSHRKSSRRHICSTEYEKLLAVWVNEWRNSRPKSKGITNEWTADLSAIVFDYSDSLSWRQGYTGRGEVQILGNGEVFISGSRSTMALCDLCIDLEKEWNVHRSQYIDIEFELCDDQAGYYCNFGFLKCDRTTGISIQKKRGYGLYIFFLMKKKRGKPKII
ncbi:hypothetical protein RFI_20603 [Reticulomyxa filosa]|uniref:Uncharacterized protein n=1 Tax=Reticulomyxa filosa TaxID=46433 RepID=X6MTE7_RETFI|nr:hypothetical protein RFI_20603 [Reticulomyxa filosa]|eukprot:ETO16737.1 hypothetical protein RFI_20603 [Reticulomyxa filosa]